MLGAGLMGSGIACVAAEAGVPVRIKDASLEALGRGLQQVRAVYDERRKRRSLTEREVGQRMDLISPALDLRGFARADLVIEAVFEDLELKRGVLAELESGLPESAVFASNTSSIPIGEIAQGCRNPGRVLGMHFFSPVPRMPLLEVVVTPETEPVAVATAAGFGRRLGKHVIVVRDGPGFYTSRALAALHERGDAGARGGGRRRRARPRDDRLRLPGRPLCASRRGRDRRRGARRRR